MRKVLMTVVVLIVAIVAVPCMAAQTFKSPDGKKSVSYTCSAKGKTMSCTLALTNGSKKIALQKTGFKASPGYKVSEHVNYCKVAWGPGSDKLVYYCYYEDNIPENEIFPDQNVFLYFYDLATNKKRELKKGGLKSEWSLGNISSNSSCLTYDDVSWGRDQATTYLKFDGKNITYHVVQYSLENFADAFCQKMRCVAGEDTKMCVGPLSTVLSIVTQDTTGKVVSRKDACFYYDVCD